MRKKNFISFINFLSNKPFRGFHKLHKFKTSFIVKKEEEAKYARDHAWTKSLCHIILLFSLLFA